MERFQTVVEGKAICPVLLVAFLLLLAQESPIPVGYRDVRQLLQPALSLLRVDGLPVTTAGHMWGYYKVQQLPRSARTTEHLARHFGVQVVRRSLKCWRQA